MRFQKTIFTIILLSVAICLSSQTASFMTLNIRYDNPKDKPNSWPERKAEMVLLLNHYEPDIFGIQEGLEHQVKYLDSCLLEYAYIGVGRDDGKKAGEYSAIFYDSTSFKVVENSTFWLSETPEEISVGWDASMERICTYGLFQHKKKRTAMLGFQYSF